MIAMKKFILKALILVGLCMTIVAKACATEKTVKIGEKSPDFTLPDQDNTQQTLSAIYKNSWVIVYFYPSDDTPGCTKQACSLRDKYVDFKTLNITILGISYNSVQSHKDFKNKYHLPFTLLSDNEKKVATAYGAKNWWFLPFPKRMTFIIDQAGIIRNIMDNVDVTTHGQDIITKIKQLQAQPNTH